jgi:hypothetical protein
MTIPTVSMPQASGSSGPQWCGQEGLRACRSVLPALPGRSPAARCRTIRSTTLRPYEMIQSWMQRRSSSSTGPSKRQAASATGHEYSPDRARSHCCTNATTSAALSVRSRRNSTRDISWVSLPLPCHLRRRRPTVLTRERPSRTPAPSSRLIAKDECCWLTLVLRDHVQPRGVGLGPVGAPPSGSDSSTLSGIRRRVPGVSTA